MLSTTCPIEYLPLKLDVTELVKQIEDNPSLWNRHTIRTQNYVHSSVSDIWVRYNAWENFTGDIAKFNSEHESSWYPAAKEIPKIKDIVYDVMDHVNGIKLGGVLITKIPPGGMVRPHKDCGWHAQYYDKYAVQLKGNDRQAFCFESKKLSAMPGEVYMFDNSQVHWVINDSEEDRMTLIICIRSH